MRHVPLLLAILTFALLPFGAQGQAPPASPAATPDERSMSREDRIKLHQARIDKIIKENERRRAEDARKAAEAKQGAPPGAPPPGGTPVPAVPVVTYSPARPPQATPQPQAAAPKGARSEARSILYFKPYDSVVNVGDTFETDLVADTKDGSVDALSVLIRYPTHLLNPMAVNYADMKHLVKEQFDYSLDAEAGELYVRAPFKQATKLVTESLFTVTWEAIDQSEGADIKIVSDETRKTGLFLGGMNVLGTFGGLGDGVIHTTVMIRDPKAKPFVQQQPDKGVLVATTRVDRPEPVMRLGLRSSKESVRQGDLFHVDVKLANPDEKPFDHVRLLLKYNPQDFEVVDWDYGNWIRSGINVQDGFAHEKFPFDFHKYNEVDGKRGTVLYEAATGTQALRAEGSLVKVRFRALRPAEASDITLVGGPGGGANASDVTYLRQSVLEGEGPDDGTLDVVSLEIDKPRPGTVATPAPAGVRGSAVVVGGRGRPAGGL